MKNLKNSINLLHTCFLLLMVFMVNAQSSATAERSRQRLVSDLVFVYVEKPELPSSNASASTVLNNSDIAANQNLTGDFWTNSNNQASQDLVKKLLQPATDADSRKLQYLTASILSIQNKRVTVYLFNDHNNATLTSIDSTWVHPNLYGANNQLNNPESNPWVWPHAQHDIQGEFTGYLSMGAAFLSEFISGQDAAKATILHELVHTQDNSEFATTFGQYYYGRDNSHFWSELLSNYFAAYKEGIANAFELLYHRYANIYDWLNVNRQLPYEVIPSADCAGLPVNSCLDRYLSATHSITPDTTRTRTSGSTSFTQNSYRMQFLPSDVLVHNETVQAYIFYAFMRWFSVTALVNDIKAVISNTNNDYGFPHVFAEMVKTGNNYQNPDVTGASHGQYFPIALLDYYTAFNLDDKATLDRCLRTVNSDDWTVDISNYWAPRHRDRILSQFSSQPNGYEISFLRNMAVHFNMRP